MKEYIGNAKPVKKHSAKTRQAFPSLEIPYTNVYISPVLPGNHYDRQRHITLQVLSTGIHPFLQWVVVFPVDEVLLVYLRRTGNQ